MASPGDEAATPTASVPSGRGPESWDKLTGSGTTGSTIPADAAAARKLSRQFGWSARPRLWYSHRSHGGKSMSCTPGEVSPASSRTGSPRWSQNCPPTAGNSRPHRSRVWLTDSQRP